MRFSSSQVWGSRLLVLFGMIAVLALAACGASGSSGTPGSGDVSTATPTTGAAGATIVATSTASVSGTSETILTDASGRTLYYFTPDTSTSSACTTGCTSIWPPLLAAPSGTPTSTGSLPGTLSAADVGNGMQVLYNGHPLYRYSGDTSSGQTNGEGIQGKWHVATPSLAVNSAPAGPTPTKCSGYYCY